MIILAAASLTGPWAYAGTLLAPALRGLRPGGGGGFPVRIVLLLIVVLVVIGMWWWRNRR
jgi:hypothetical protein